MKYVISWLQDEKGCSILANIRDVAKKAGVSIKMVSGYLNNKDIFFRKDRSDDPTSY